MKQAKWNTRLLLSVMVILTTLLLTSVAFSKAVNDNANDGKIAAIVDRLMRGELVSQEEKELAYPAFLAQYASQNAQQPAIDRTGGPDAAGYVFKDQLEVGGPTFSWIDHTAAAHQMNNTEWTSGDDNTFGPITLPFTFNFYGSAYTSIYMNTNGNVSFAPYSSIPSTALPITSGPALIAFWTGDMVTAPYSTVAATSRARYEAFVSPEQMFVITYDSLGNYSTGANRVSCQIILYPNGNVKLQYRDISGTWTANGVGIQNTSASTYLSYGTPLPTNNTAILFYQPCYRVTPISPANGSIGISAGTVPLTWTPGTCTATVSIYYSNVQADVIAMAPAAFQATVPAINGAYNVTAAANQIYYWRLVGDDGSGATIPSSVWNFSTFAALSGTINVGPGESITTISQAVAALYASGVGAGGVTFNVAPGTYNERILFSGPIPGASLANPVVFQESAPGAEVRAFGTAATNDYLLKFFGASFVTWDGIDLISTGASTADYVEYGVWMAAQNATTGSQYNTVKNCNISVNRATTSSRGVYHYYTQTPTAASGTNSYNKYLNLKITNAFYGMYVYGVSSTYPDLGTEIGSTTPGVNFAGRLTIGSGTGDDIGGLGLVYGLYVYMQSGVSVHDIDIRNLYVQSTTSALYGLYMSTCPNNPVIYNNRIYNLNHRGSTTSNGSVYGMYLSPGTGTLKVYNNMVYALNSLSTRTTAIATQYVYGMYTANTLTVYDFSNNTIAINASGGTASPLYSSSALYLSSMGAGTTLRNNIFANLTADQSGVCKHFGVYRLSSSALTSDNNVFYVPNVLNGFVGYASAADRPSLADWQAATAQDAASASGNPLFVDAATDPHLQIGVNGNPCENTGVPVAWVTTDIDNETRSGTPDIGADEGQFSVADACAPSDLVISDVATNSFLASWTDNCPTETGYNVYTSADGVTYTLYSTVGANVTSCLISGVGINEHVYVRVFAVYAGGSESLGYAGNNRWTLVTPSGSLTMSLTGTGYSTGQVDAIGVDLNPSWTNYKIQEIGSGLYINSAGSLSASPRLATKTAWQLFAVTGLTRSTTYNFQAIPVNGDNIAGVASASCTLTTNDYASSAGPDGFGYSYKTSAAPGGPVYNWVDISGTGTALTFNSLDDGSAAVPLGTFAFSYYGTPVTSLYAITNGMLQASATPSTTFGNSVLPAATVQPMTMFPWWDDQYMTAPWSWVKYQDMLDGRFVVSFYTADYNSGGTPDSMAYQVVLYTSGRILFQYRMSVVPGANSNGTIGIQGATTGTNFLQWAQTDISFPVGPTGPGFAIEFTTLAAPTYVSPTDLATDVTVSPTLTWNAAGGASGYDVYLDTANPPTTMVSSNQAGTTYTVAAPLTAGTVYYWRVDARSGTSVAAGAVWSFTTGTAPEAPVLSITYAGGNANLSWAAITGATGYRIYRSTSGYFTPAVGNWVADVGAVTTYTDTGVSGAYYYKITAINAVSTARFPGSETIIAPVSRRSSSKSSDGMGTK